MGIVKIAILPAEFDEIFIEHKPSIGKCKIAKQKIEVEPHAVPQRKDAWHTSPDKATKANQRVENLSDLGFIPPSFWPWASDIVLVKKQS